MFRGSEVTTHPIGSSPQFIARYDGLAALVVGTVAELLAFPDAGGDTRAIWLRPRSGPTLRPTDWPSPQVVTLPSLNRVVLGLDFHESKKNVFWPADHIAVLDLNQSALVKVPGLDPKGPSFWSQMLAAALQGAVLGGVSVALNAPMPTTFPMYSPSAAVVRGKPGHFTVTPDESKIIMLAPSARSLVVMDPRGGVSQKAVAITGDPTTSSCTRRAGNTLRLLVPTTSHSSIRPRRRWRRPTRSGLAKSSVRAPTTARGRSS